MTAGSSPSWRVGRSQPHNVYMDDVHRLVVLGEPTDAAELAGHVVASLNADARRAQDTPPAPSAGEDEAAVVVSAPLARWVVASLRDNGWTELADEIGAALAAARGPRTQDGT